MVLYNVVVDADRAIKTTAQRAIGWSGDIPTYNHSALPENGVYVQPELIAKGLPMSNVPAGSAIDQINLMYVVTPNITNLELVNTMYSPIAAMALTLFSTLLLVAVIAHLWGKIIDEYPTDHAMVLLVKRCVFEIPAIYFGIDIFAAMLLGNEVLSTMFAGTVSVGALCVQGMLDPSGIIVFAYAVGTALTAWFYVCRFYIVVVTLMLWPIGCILGYLNLQDIRG